MSTKVPRQKSFTMSIIYNRRRMSCGGFGVLVYLALVTTAIIVLQTARCLVYDSAGGSSSISAVALQKSREQPLPVTAAALPVVPAASAPSVVPAAVVPAAVVVPAVSAAAPIKSAPAANRYVEAVFKDNINGYKNLPSQRLPHQAKLPAIGKVLEMSHLQKLRPLRNGSKPPSEDTLLTQQRFNIQKEMEGYTMHPSLSAISLEELVLELGGQPVRNMVVTTWRSGSTFLGDVMQAHPGTFYHYEPLLNLEIRQARSGPLADIAINNLDHLMKCNYTGMDQYLNYGKTHAWLLSHNTRLWWTCIAFRKLCSSQDFMTAFCKLFPFQSIKMVRLRMNLTEHFLQDKNLDVRVLLLVRDPRGTMQSRRHRDWCPGNDDCENPARLCEDLLADYHAAQKLAEKFPGRVRVIRYEDLSFNPYKMTLELFDFFRLTYVASVDHFLRSHTTNKIGGVSSTFRNSKMAPVHWKTDFTFEQVARVQSLCRAAMKAYGYRLANNPEHLAQLDPLTEFKFPVI